MNEFDYAQSNSLLKQEIEDLPTNNECPPEPSSFEINGYVHTSVAKTKKTIPAKKSQHSKHRSKIPTTTSNIVPAAVPTLESKSIRELETDTIVPINAAPLNPKNSDQVPNLEPKKQSRKPRVRKPRRVIPNEKEYIPENEQPTQSDVVGGRGGRSNHHPGNRPYWIRILESRTEYTKSRSDHEKSRIANGILRYVQEELRGRFLNIDSKTKRWYVLPNTVVLDKIKQALRDKYIPYWARDLKIDDKKHNPLDSMLATEGTIGGNTALRQSIVNKRSQPGLDAMMPFSSLYSSMHNSHMLASFNASRINTGTTSNLPNPAATSRVEAAPATANSIEKATNKLDFLLSAPTRQQMGRTAAIPTIDDLLKCKIDQMPSFGGVSNAEIVAAAMANAPPPSIPSLGLNPFQSNQPLPLLTSFGLGGLGGTGGLLNEALNQNHGFGATGNLGAPALSTTPSSTSLGVLQNLSMASLDKYLEGRAGLSSSLASPTSFATPGFSGANLPSLSRLNALAGTSFDSAASHSSSAGLAAAFAAPVATVPTGPKKTTDWNAMYTKALTRSK